LKHRVDAPLTKNNFAFFYFFRTCLYFLVQSWEIWHKLSDIPNYRRPTIDSKCLQAYR
jgi:hypothetical protein